MGISGILCAAGVTVSHVASAPLFSKCSPTFARYTKESVPDPHNPQDIFLAEENGYFLIDFGILGNIRFCFTIRSFSRKREGRE